VEGTDLADIRRAEIDVICDRFSQGKWVATAAHAPLERELTVYVNLHELVTILCTPRKLKYLVLGFLYAEGIISSIDDVIMMRVCDEESEVDVRLKNPAFELPTKRRLTSGCGGGSTFSMKGQEVESDLMVTPNEVMSLMKQLQNEMDLYQLSGGVHTSALSDKGKLIVLSEDIGRHNTLDKIQGECLAMGVSTTDRLILTTGRVSSEMLLKAARMKTPIVVSRHTPTGTAISLAHDLGIALVGRANSTRLSVYSHPERLGQLARGAAIIDPNTNGADGSALSEVTNSGQCNIAQR
jgi:FdhD protein